MHKKWLKRPGGVAYNNDTNKHEKEQQKLVLHSTKQQNLPFPPKCGHMICKCDRKTFSSTDCASQDQPDKKSSKRVALSPFVFPLLKVVSLQMDMTMWK
jgi:hypothetical protein